MLKNLLNRILPTARGTAPAPAPAPAPDDVARADALIAQGDDLEDAGDPQRAEALYRRAIAAAPRHPRGHLNLGIVLAAQGDNDGAARAYEAVLAIDPHHPFGNYNFARIAILQGDFARAERLAREALRAKPEFPQALVVLSSALDSLERREEALEPLQAAVRLQPEDAGAWFNMAALLIKLKRSDAALDATERVLELAPDHASSLGMLSLLLRDHRFVPEVLEVLRAAIRADPNNLTYQSQELLLLNFDDGISAEELFRRHVEFGTRLEQTVPARFDRFLGSDDAGRRLRIGYLSGDFNLHPVMLFFLPVLEFLDRAEFEVFCYSTANLTDEVTRHAREKSEHWLDGSKMTDTELADAIHADAIDILIDMTGHTTVPRAGVFSQRPAPVQASWVGYLNTSGLTRMDYRVTDRRCDPPEISQAVHTEKLIYLPESQWCYRPLVQSTVNPVAPLEKNGHVTFGSFNDALKLTSAMCRRWGELLVRVPDSRLVVASISSGRKRDLIRGEMAALGVAPERYKFVERVPLNEYPDLVSTVDMALDTFPYGGGTTTFDALWMGVPVVTAIGVSPASRSAASILRALGLDEWVAQSIDDFVDVAAARAADHQAISALRRSLRPRLQASPLADVPRFVRDMASVYREMWASRRR